MKLTSIIAVLAFAFVANATEATKAAATTTAPGKVVAKADAAATTASADATAASGDATKAPAKKGKKK